MVHLLSGSLQLPVQTGRSRRPRLCERPRLRWRRMERGRWAQAPVARIELEIWLEPRRRHLQVLSDFSKVFQSGVGGDIAGDHARGRKKGEERERERCRTSCQRWKCSVPQAGTSSHGVARECRRPPEGCEGRTSSGSNRKEGGLEALDLRPKGLKSRSSYPASWEPPSSPRTARRPKLAPPPYSRLHPARRRTTPASSSKDRNCRPWLTSHLRLGQWVRGRKTPR
jgi:hypothetical protein